MQRSASLGNIYSNALGKPYETATKRWMGYYFDDFSRDTGCPTNRLPIPNASVAFNEAVTTMVMDDQIKPDSCSPPPSDRDKNNAFSLSLESESENQINNHSRDANDLVVENIESSDEQIFNLTGENASTASSSSVGNIGRKKSLQRRNSAKSTDSLPVIQMNSSNQIRKSKNDSSDILAAFSAQNNQKSTKTKRPPPRSRSSNFIKQYATSSISAVPPRDVTSSGTTPRNRLLRRSLSIEDLSLKTDNTTPKAQNRKHDSPYT